MPFVLSEIQAVIIIASEVFVVVHLAPIRMDEGEIKGDGIDVSFDIVKVNEVQIVLLMDRIVYAVAAMFDQKECHRSISIYSPLCSNRISVHIDQCRYCIGVGAVKTITYDRLIGFFVKNITKKSDFIIA
jgi:hypothetical protein